MADKKVDRPSDHDFFMAIYDNLPSREDNRKMWLGMAGTYALGKAVKRRGSSKRK